jgi:hypothetical protein
MYLYSLQIKGDSNKTKKNVIETKSSLPYSQETSTGQYTEPDQSITYHLILSLQDLTKIGVAPHTFSQICSFMKILSSV